MTSSGGESESYYTLSGTLSSLGSYTKYFTALGAAAGACAGVYRGQPVVPLAAAAAVWGALGSTAFLGAKEVLVRCEGEARRRAGFPGQGTQGPRQVEGFHHWLASGGVVAAFLAPALRQRVQPAAVAGMLAGGAGYVGGVQFDRWRLAYVEHRRELRAWERFIEERDAAYHARDPMGSWSASVYMPASERRSGILMDKKEVEEARERVRDA